MNGHRELRLDAPGARRRGVLPAGGRSLTLGSGRSWPAGTGRSWLFGSVSTCSGRWRG